MKRELIVFTMMAISLAGASGFARSEPSRGSTENGAHEKALKPEAKTIHMGVDLLPFVGLSSGLPEARRGVSVNIGGGISGGVDVLELAGGFNIDTGKVYGLQMAGGANIVRGDVEAAQMSGGVNVVTGEVIGAQFAGGANIVAGTLSGAQFAGGANIVANDVRGLQIAPLNLAGGEVKGLQLGVVNIAKRSTASIGLISIVSDGVFDVEVFGSEDGLALAGIRNGGDHFYNVYYAGASLLGESTEVAFGLGLGWRTMLSDSWEVQADVGATQLIEDLDFDGSLNNLFRFRPMVSWRANSSFAVFGGPTLNLLLTDKDLDLIDRAIWEFSDKGDTLRTGMWIGGTLGVRLL